MMAHEILRAAADIIAAGGWSQGATARDASGMVVHLFSGIGSGTGRSIVNPAAVSFSIYGAIVKAVGDHGLGEHQGVMWDALYRAARADGVPPGGNNYVHPLIGFNDARGRTRAEVLAFLRRVADEVESLSAPRLEAEIIPLLPSPSTTP